MYRIIVAIFFAVSFSKPQAPPPPWSSKLHPSNPAGLAKTVAASGPHPAANSWGWDWRVEKGQ